MPVYTCDVPTAVADSGFTASTSTVYSCITDASDATYAHATITAGQKPEATIKLRYSGAITGIPYRYRGIARISTHSIAHYATSDQIGVTGTAAPPTPEMQSQVTANNLSTTVVERAGSWNAVTNENLSGDFTYRYTGNWNTSYYSGASLRLYQLRVEIETTTVPSVTVTASPTVETSQPTVAWVWSDGDGWAQSRAVVKVFDSAVYGGGGFNPETSIPVWSTTLDGTGLTAVVASGLVNNGTYRTYVKSAKLVNGIYQYSSWANNAAWQYISLPPSASIAAAWTLGTQSMTLTCYGSVNLLTANQSDLETDTTGWVVNSNCSITRSLTYAKYGVASLRLSSTAAGNMAAYTTAGTGGIPVQPSTSYAIQAYSRAGASARSAYVGVQWFDSAGTIIGSQVNGSGTTNSTANFNTHHTLVAVSPANAAFASVVFTVASTAAASELHYVDGIILATGTGTVNWCKGGMTNIVGLLEREDPDGWRVVRGGRVSGSAAAGRLIVTDYESRRGVTVNYRYTVSGTHSLGFALSSAAATASAAATSDNAWWFKVLDDPTLNAQTNVLAPLKVSIEADVGIFRPLDANAAVAVTGQVYGEDGEYRFMPTTNADYVNEIRPLMVYAGTILVQDPLGRHKWVRWTTPRDIEETSAAGEVQRLVTLGYIEVLPDEVV